MFDLVVELVHCDDEFGAGVVELFGELGGGVLWAGGGGHGADGHHREESDREEYGVGRQDEDDVVVGDVEVEEGVGEG